jgi:hypothetical protein
MATQLAQRPSRITRAPGSLGKVERMANVKDTLSMMKKKPVTLNFALMIGVAVVLDAFSFFLSEFGVGFIFSILAAVMFIPWFYFTKSIGFNMSRAVSMASTFILELFPLTGNLPCITINVFYTYYSE